MTANGPARARFWQDFLLSRSGYPATDRLAEQLSGAEAYDFCACGCNSFRVRANAAARPLTTAVNMQGDAAIYEVDYLLEDGRSLEIIMFTDGLGNLAFVEIDCCGNSEPVPDRVELATQPYHRRISDSVLG